MRNLFFQNFSIFRRMFSSTLGGFFNILVVGIALSLPTGLFALLQNGQEFASQLSNTPEISLYLQMDAQEADINQLRRTLENNHNITHSEFIPRSSALEKLKQSSGLVDVINGLEKNPLPDAFIVYPKQNEAQALEELRNDLAKLPKIDIAQLDSAWAYKLEALLKFGRIVVIILAGLLSLALIAITFNTIRLQILTRHDEIEVARLIGATNGFIRRPFLYFGLTLGLLGGITAWLIIAVSFLLLNYQLSSLMQLYASKFVLHPLSLGDSITLLMFSTYLGWLGAWLSVVHYLMKVEAR